MGFYVSAQTRIVHLVQHFNEFLRQFDRNAKNLFVAFLWKTIKNLSIFFNDFNTQTGILVCIFNGTSSCTENEMGWNSGDAKLSCHLFLVEFSTEIAFEFSMIFVNEIFSLLQCRSHLNGCDNKDAAHYFHHRWKLISGMNLNCCPSSC